MIGTIGPIMIVTKVAMNWQNKLTSATCPHVSTAASRLEFLQDITTFSDFKAGSEVVSCKLLSHNVDAIQCLINVLVLFYFIWQVVISNHSALCKAFLIDVVRSKLQAYVTKSNGLERNKGLLHVLNKKKNAFQMFSFFSDMETRYCSVVSPDLNLVKH